MNKIIEGRGWKIALAWLVIAAVMAGYYWAFWGTMPSVYFFLAVGVLFIGVIARLAVDGPLQGRFGKNSWAVQFARLLVDAALAGALIAMFALMYRT